MLRTSATILALVLALLAAPATWAGEPLTPAELSARLAREDAPLLLDVRTPQEFAAGHIPGAVLIPHDALAARLGELDPERPVVVYCRTGRRATIAEALLRGHGFEVSQLQGSWQAWQAADLPQAHESATESTP